MASRTSEVCASRPGRSHSWVWGGSGTLPGTRGCMTWRGVHQPPRGQRVPRGEGEPGCDRPSPIPRGTVLSPIAQVSPRVLAGPSLCGLQRGPAQLCTVVGLIRFPVLPQCPLLVPQNISPRTLYLHTTVLGPVFLGVLAGTCRQSQKAAAPPRDFAWPHGS